MATLRELKGRIGSVASSEKITGAMKMISSAKMHKAEQSLKRLVPYRSLIEDIIGTLLDSDAEFSSPLTTPRDVNTMAIVVLGSDDGLCGAYNVNIYKQLIAHIAKCRKELGDKARIVVMPVGSKMAKIVSKLQLPGVTTETVTVNSKSAGQDVSDFLKSLTSRYEALEMDRVDLLYMNFLSVSRQRARIEQLMPLSPDAMTTDGDGISRKCRPCLFEPSAADIFVAVVPMFMLAIMQQVFTENRASEQAARVMAMQSANDNAKKLLEQLRLEYNKLRQQSITTELLDIVGGQVR